MVDEVNSTSAEGSLERVTCIFPSVPDTSALVSLAFEDKLQKGEGDHCTNQCHIMEVEDEDWSGKSGFTVVLSFLFYSEPESEPFPGAGLFGSIYPYIHIPT